MSFASPILAKTFRALQRSWKAKNVESHPLIKEDITTLITTVAVYLRKELQKKTEKRNEEKLKKKRKKIPRNQKSDKKSGKKKNVNGKELKESEEESDHSSDEDEEEVIDIIPEFCAAFKILLQCLEVKSMEPLFVCKDCDTGNHGKEKEEEISIRHMTLSPDCSVKWTHRGLITLFKQDEFTFLFFQSFALLVQQFSKEFTNSFGTVHIPTDDSITEALTHLPPGYLEIFMILQYEIAAETVPALFIAVYDSAVGFGGPGTTLRLIIDMVESQLFNTKAIEAQLIQKPVKDMTIGSALLDAIIGVLGPFPVNMAYGPILMHLFYVEAAATPPRYDLLFDFLEHCNNPDYGVGSKDENISIHRMGLFTVIGSFIFNNKPAEMNHRLNDLFCRSQIPNENVASLLPLEILKKVMDTVCNVEDYDDFVFISIGNAVNYIDKYGLELVSEANIRKLHDLLVSDPVLYKDVIDEDCYQQLLSVCKKILMSRELLKE